MSEKTPRDYQWDGYAKAACDVPYDRELESMNDKQLDIELERGTGGSARRSSLQRERDKRDRELGRFVMPLPPDESFHRLKAVFRWLKEHVLASVVSVVIATFLTTILVFYTTQWLTKNQATPPQQNSQTKAPKTAPP